MTSSGYSWSNPTNPEGSGHTDWQVNTSHDKFDASNYPYGVDKQEEVKIVVAGAPGVGKTAIVKQFVRGHFETSYYPTNKRETYYPSVILHDRNYPLKIVDTPDVPFFPANSYYTITDLQAYGLRDANGYVLVYDLLAPDTFEFINNLFNQISEARDLSRVPVVVVGNKTDKISCSGPSPSSRFEYSSKYRSTSGHHDKYDDYHHHDSFGFHGEHDHFDHGFGHHHDSFHHHRSPKHGKDSKYRHYDDHHHSSHKRHGRHGRHGFMNGHSSFSSRTSSRLQNLHSQKKIFYYEEDNYLERETADRVTNEWHAIYRECSAQDPESVNRVFKALMEVVDENGLDDGKEEDDGPKKCIIL